MVQKTTNLKMSSISWWSSYLKMKIWWWQNRANLHLCMTEKILSWMIILALIVHHIVWLQLMIWTWKNRANFHLCITENILSRMTIPALIIHHVVLAASLSKKRTKLIINVERMNAFVIFVLLAFFFYVQASMYDRPRIGNTVSQIYDAT